MDVYGCHGLYRYTVIHLYSDTPSELGGCEASEMSRSSFPRHGDERSDRVRQIEQNANGLFLEHVPMMFHSEFPVKFPMEFPNFQWNFSCSKRLIPAIPTAVPAKNSVSGGLHRFSQGLPQ